jgi:hypothetical protein
VPLPSCFLATSSPPWSPYRLYRAAQRKMSPTPLTLPSKPAHPAKKRNKPTDGSTTPAVVPAPPPAPAETVTSKSTLPEPDPAPASPHTRRRKLTASRPIAVSLPAGFAVTGPTAHIKGGSTVLVRRGTNLGSYMRRCKKLILETGYA